MNITTILQNAVAKAAKELYALDLDPETVICAPTRREFEGDFTITVFGMAKAARKAPPMIGEELGQYLVENADFIAKYNVIQGFLNLVVADAFWKNFVKTQIEAIENQSFGTFERKNEKVMIEYSSPNTNKPLHLGHVRNILLGWSCSRILEAAGYDIVRTKVVNDRGIAICKSMLAWQLYGNGATPVSTDTKGDHFVGDYYVMFEKYFKEEYSGWQGTDFALEVVFDKKKKEGQTPDEFFKEYKNIYFNEYSELGKQAREMLQKWENGDAETVALWEKMNGWVYEGFNETYKQIGVGFDKIYYESATYTLGKDIIEDGILRGVFYRKPDTSVWIDLTAEKLDHKLVLRSDGTSVYITQDIGMARLRESEFGARKVVYVVADEQNYHFQVLFEILKKLGEPYADGLFHLSYGMVELPSGRMKSREGTVVDADDLMQIVRDAAAAEATERNSFIKDSPEDVRKVGFAALKYDILKVNPKKKMIFNPEESVSFEGNTGPYIQYAYVRSNGVVRDAGADFDFSAVSNYPNMNAAEKELIGKFYEYERIVTDAAASYDPSIVAAYCYDVAKTFNRFWHECPILKVEDADTRLFRLQLAQITAQILEKGMGLLGIEMPEKM